MKAFECALCGGKVIVHSSSIYNRISFRVNKFSIFSDSPPLQTCRFQFCLFFQVLPSYVHSSSMYNCISFRVNKLLIFSDSVPLQTWSVGPGASCRDGYRTWHLKGYSLFSEYFEDLTCSFSFFSILLLYHSNIERFCLHVLISRLGHHDRVTAWPQDGKYAFSKGEICISQGHSYCIGSRIYAIVELPIRIKYNCVAAMLLLVCRCHHFSCDEDWATFLELWLRSVYKSIAVLRSRRVSSLTTLILFLLVFCLLFLGSSINWQLSGWNGHRSRCGKASWCHH